MIKRGLLVFALACAAAPHAAADELRPFCADRPGKGAAACILDEGHWQVEVGLFDGSRQTDPGFETEGSSYGDLFVRYGLTRSTEIQMGVTAHVVEETTDQLTGLTERAEGVSDLFFAARHALTDPDGDGPAASILGFVTAPTGSDEVSAGQAEGGVVLAYIAPLNETWELALAPEIDLASDADGDGHHAAYAFVAGVSRGFGQWNLGAEVWVARDDDPLGAVTQSTFDLTAVWEPGWFDGQIDFGLNFGLNDDSPDVEFGVGVARRF